MEFRPCIDIHNGKVKQIVGGTLLDEGDYAAENFVSDLTGADYANLYKKNGLTGGHIILLNSVDSEYYKADLDQAKSALEAWPNSLQIGGGITADNAKEILDLGASHVIVTSYVFADGEIKYDRLEKLLEQVGKEHLVLDLSCRKKDGEYYIVTNRWQKFTNQPLSKDLFDKLSSYCDEFLVHAVNVEGTKGGVDEELLQLLATSTSIPITYAGGIGSLKDLDTIRKIGGNKINFTVGSALDIFGGDLPFDEVVKC